ncbi:MAG: hypothetical protein JOY62_10620 [Acidobacteriaceae bacterium]|nr:hypothetical protein [Acidobacteriaceae bacterium]MBV9780413.1 hypothetical protein [Acidobacteriaceae bacterium]
MPNKGKHLRIALMLLWLAGIIWGTRILVRYENTPAQAARVSERWPIESKLSRSRGFPTLVILAHPNCPCTRATIAELELIMAQLRGRIQTFVMFYKPGANGTEVAGSDLWRKARSIPGVSVLYDRAGTETQLFGGRVSGQTLLYSPEGKLVFSGGITSGRGHPGDNEGADAVIRCVRRNGSEIAHSPVFGCSLHDPSRQALKEDKSWTRE